MRFSKIILIVLALLAATGTILLLPFRQTDETEQAALEFGPPAEEASPQATPPPPGPRALPPEPFAPHGPVESGRADESGQPPPGVMENEMLVEFSDRESLVEFLTRAAALGADILGVIPELNAARIGYDDPELSRNLRRLLPDGAEEGYNFLVLTPNLPPPFTGGQNEPYSPFGDRTLSWLGVPEDNAAWGSGITVAVLDTGISPHADFHGKNIRQLDLVGHDARGTPYSGHGTAVAALFAGARGIAPGADLLSVRVLDEDGSGNGFSVAQGIVAAVDEGARILSLSLGTFGDSAVLRNAVQYALDRDVLLVAAAGNESVRGLPYPAGYDGVLAVTAVDAESRRAGFANVSPQIDVAAPGVGIHTAWENNETRSFSGTSASAPLVAGALATLLAKEPNLGPREAADALRNNANDVGPPGPDAETGYGTLDMDRLLRRNERGVYDLAVADFHLSAEAEHAGAPFQVTVQNRGTERIGSVRLELRIDGRTETLFLGDLEAGEVKAAGVPLSFDALQGPEGVPVFSRVSAPGIEDARPENDARSIVLRPWDDDEP